MKTKTLSILLIFLFLVLSSMFPVPVHAVSDLTVDFGVPPGSPIFNINNMAPGQIEIRNVEVTNNAGTPRFAAVKGLKTGGVGADPKLETVLEIIIRKGGLDLYGGTLGTRTVKQFFDDSSLANGIPLTAIPAGGTHIYDFKVTFPTTAGNEFQAKSVIFDLKIGEITGNNLVINEVYYQVDPAHGLDSPKDRGILNVNSNQVTAIIRDTGAGSTNIVKISLNQACKIIQSNQAGVINDININSNTGGNTANQNTGLGSIFTGWINNLVNVVSFGNLNVGSCGKKLGQNDEWLEIYNPTQTDISLKNWRLVDNSGIERKINANKKVKAGGFALLSKDASTWQNWNEDPQAQKVELGSQIGDGLDNPGDHLILKNPGGLSIDAVGWGNDTAIWNPAVLGVPLGSSIERLVPGFDTDLPSDWHENASPDPGS